MSECELLPKERAAPAMEEHLINLAECVAAHKRMTPGDCCIELAGLIKIQTEVIIRLTEELQKSKNPESPSSTNALAIPAGGVVPDPTLTNLLALDGAVLKYRPVSSLGINASGSFIWGGYREATTQNFAYDLFRGVVTIRFANVSGVKTAPGLLSIGVISVGAGTLPSLIRPAVSFITYVPIIVNGISSIGEWVVKADGGIDWYATPAATGFINGANVSTNGDVYLHWTTF